MALGSVSNIWMGGRPSGLPNNIEDQLTQVKQRQLVQPIQEDIEETKSLKSSYAKLDSNLTDLVQVGKEVNSEDVFQARSAASSDESVVTATADSGAALMSASVDVTNLAQAHTQLVGVETDGTGGLEGIVGSDPQASEDPAKIADNVTVSFYHEGSKYDYTTDSETTLASLADSISGEGNGVRAEVTNIGTLDNPEYALRMKSESTGAGEHRITQVNGDGTDSGTSGITVHDGDSGSVGADADLFAIGDNTASTDQTTSLSGQNASFSVDGVAYERASNSVSDIYDGVTFELQDSGSANVSVSKDADSAASKVESLVNAFNSAQDFLDKATNYDEEEETSGPLMGSSLANAADIRMSRSIQDPISGTSGNAYQYLSEVGVDFARDGSLEFDSAKFKEAMLANPQAVQELFVGDNGAGERLASSLQSLTDDTDGSLTYKMESLTRQVDRYEDKLSDAEREVDNYQERLVSRFTAMENAVREYQNMQDQIESWTNTWKSMQEG